MLSKTSNADEISLVILHEAADTSEGREEIERTIDNVREILGIAVNSYPVTSPGKVGKKDLVYLLAVLKSQDVVKAIEEVPKRGATLIGKLPLEHVAGKAAERVKEAGCREVILLYRKTPGVYKEEQDDAWRLATLIENLSGIPVTPSDTPELGGDCIVVTTLAKSRLTSEAYTIASMYDKKVVAESILSLMEGDVPHLVRRALRASGIIL